MNEYGRFEQKVLNNLGTTIENVTESLGKPIVKDNGKYHARKNSSQNSVLTSDIENLSANSTMENSKSMGRTLKPSGYVSPIPINEEQVGISDIEFNKQNNNYFTPPSKTTLGYADTLILPSIVALIFVVAAVTIFILKYVA